MIIRTSDKRITAKEAVGYIETWEASPEYHRLKMYRTYYESENAILKAKVHDRKERGKTPNYFIPTAYYSTLVDTMSGYLFQNIQYDGDNALSNVMKENNAEVKDMKDGVAALAYNRAVEYVYTKGDETNIEYRFTPIDTLSVILIYNADIEPEMIAAIRKYGLDEEGIDYRFDIIYKDWIATYQKPKDKDKDPVLVEEKDLLFDEVPMVVYNTEILTPKSSFHSVLPYIEALDWVVTGNTNELDRLVDALLVLGKKVKDEDLKHTDEWKALQNYKTEDRAEYINKEMSPEFRRYVSELLIQEIHKHSHVIDWYSPDTGLSGAVSGKALKTRLFDMDMFSKRIEKIYREGLEKRIRLLQQVMNLTGDAGDIEVTFNRTVPSDFEDIVQAMLGVDFISTETKIKKAGLNYEEEKERLDREAEEGGIEEEFDLDVGADEIVTEVAGVTLNGAQIQAASDLAEKVAQGLLSRPEAVELVILLGVPRATAEKVIPQQGDAKAAEVE